MIQAQRRRVGCGNQRSEGTSLFVPEEDPRCGGTQPPRRPKGEGAWIHLPMKTGRFS
jgi:hypothetical protein